MQDDGASLLNVVDRTVTAMGGRLLRRWLVFPLKEVKPIEQRLDVVDYIFRYPEYRALLDKQLELMAALADLHGERVAHQRMSELSHMFDGLLPKSLLPRRTRLRG